MNTHPDPLNPHYEECMRLHHCWAWFLGLGVLVVLVGLFAIGSAFIAGFATVLLFGCLLIAGGVAQLVNAFMARCWRVFFLYLLGSIVHIVVGVLMLEIPVTMMVALTVLLAAGFMVGGILRIVYGLIEPFPGRGWVLLNGAMSLILGIAIWRQLPEASLWVIGAFVGIDLVFNGMSWIMLGLLLKSVAPKTTAAPSAPGPHEHAPAASS
ncbi:MAG: HdeD family acid-resistance protein [Gemmataceae bacterium]